jgi:hypothetical protein
MGERLLTVTDIRVLEFSGAAVGAIGQSMR